MINVFDITLSVPAAVLPVSGASEFENQNLAVSADESQLIHDESQLIQFSMEAGIQLAGGKNSAATADLIGSSKSSPDLGKQKVVSMIASAGDLHKVPNKPRNNDGTIQTSSYSSGGEGWWGWEEYYYYDDPYAYLDIIGANMPEYGMQTVIISGQSLDDYGDYAEIPIDFAFYYNMNAGGSNPADSGTTIPDCGPAGSGKNEVDWAKIKGYEGQRLDGYVPTKNGVPIGTSGVTVASGFDLGARNLSDLQKLGFDNSLIATLTPYLGLKGSSALNYETANPLNITQAQSDTINSAAKSLSLSLLVSKYDTSTGIAGSFFDLPAEAQTVIASVSFQYGNLALKTPNFWNQITTNNWSAAYSNLMNFGDEFGTRRQSEAALLKQAIDAGKLHDGSAC